MTTQLGGPLVTAPESRLPWLAAVARLATAASPATATFSRADSVARSRFLLPDKSLTSSRVRGPAVLGVLAVRLQSRVTAGILMSVQVDVLTRT